MTRALTRRRALALAGGAALAGSAPSLLASSAAAHTPYQQWVVYRKKHLLIGCHRADPATYAHAQRIVAALDKELPAARARIARARRPDRLASLLGTDQLEVAVLDAETAEQMRLGAGAFAPYGPIPLVAQRRLKGDGGHSLYAHADFPARHSTALRIALDHAFDPA